MHVPFENPETAAASQDRGGATERIGRAVPPVLVPLVNAPCCLQPGRSHLRGRHPVPVSPWLAQAGPHPRQVDDLPPPAPSRPAWPGSA